MAEKTSEPSIFRRYYATEGFEDRFAKDPDAAVDVIIPIIHTNELWESNLISIYREVPVNRLILGDGGCIDDSLTRARKFPRVTVIDQRNFKSLGYSIRNLIEAVETEWFIYLHSDVYLPHAWFDAMRRHQHEYEWFGCPMRITALIEYPNVDKMFEEVRPYAGSQMGKKSAFLEGLKRIDDDFVYRQEDFVFADVVKRSGYREGRVEDTFHYHQVMHKESRWGRKLKKVAVQVEWSREEEVRASTMQVKGLIKYLQPSRNLAREAEYHVLRLLELDELNLKGFRQWVAGTNAAWLPHIYRPWRYRLLRIRSGLRAFIKKIVS